MRRFAGYPRFFYPLLALAFTLLGASGVLLLPHMITMRMDWDTRWRVAGDVRLASAAVHCGVAFVVMFLLGELASLHMRTGWRRRQNLASGLLLVTLFAALVVTAVGIYYFGDEALSRWSSIVHSAAGLLLFAAVFWHGVVGHLIYNRRHNRHVRRRRYSLKNLTPRPAARPSGADGSQALMPE